MIELKPGWLQRQIENVNRNVNAWNVVKQLSNKQANLAETAFSPYEKYEFQTHAIRIMRQGLSEWEHRVNKELREAQDECQHVMVDGAPGAGGFGYNVCKKCGLTDL